MSGLGSIGPPGQVTSLACFAHLRRYGYGFVPMSAPDAEAMNEAFSAGASDDELMALRHETRMTRCATDLREREEFLQAFRAAGVTCILQNVFRHVAGRDVALQTSVHRRDFPLGMCRRENAGHFRVVVTCHTGAQQGSTRSRARPSSVAGPVRAGA